MLTSNDLLLQCIVCFGSTTNASMCPNCQKPICQSCLFKWNFRLKGCPTCKSKNVEPIKINLESIRENINVLPNCEGHHKGCNTYCSKCDQIMCDSCFLSEHKGHLSLDEGIKKFIELKKEYDQSVNQIKRINSLIEEKKSNILKTIDKFTENKKKELDEFIKKAKKDVSNQIITISPNEMYNLNLQVLKTKLKVLKEKINLNDKNSEQIFDETQQIKKEYEQLKKEIQTYTTNNLDKQLSVINLDSIVPPFINYQLIFKVNDLFGKVKSQLIFINNNYKWQVVLSKIERPVQKDIKEFELLVFLSPLLRRTTIKCKATIKSSSPLKGDHRVEGELIYDLEERNNKNIQNIQKSKTTLNLDITAEELSTYYSFQSESGYKIIIDFSFKFDYYYTLFINKS